MSRIKLKSLLSLTELAPQPPMGGGDMSGGAMPPMPPAGMNAGGPAAGTPPEADAAEPSSPEPEDPAEYDFTRDFRAFEDKKNKAESEAKKVLLDKMNKRLLNKTIVANASRGYGQPKTDYTINNVKKISVEFWYKDYVVIVTDEKDKKYFLTPGINIKIEGNGSEPAPDSNENPSAGSAPEEPKGDAGTPPADSSEPSAPTSDAAPDNGNPEPQQGGAENLAAAQQPAPKPAVPPQQAGQQQPEEEDPNNPKKKAVAEFLQKDLSAFLLEFMNKSVKDKNGNVNFTKYVSDAYKTLTESVNSTKFTCKLLIPENHFVKNVDVREIKLAAIDSTRKNTYYGQFSKGSVDIRKNGRYYLLEYVKEIGWKI